MFLRPSGFTQVATVDGEIGAIRTFFGTTGVSYIVHSPRMLGGVLP